MPNDQLPGSAVHIRCESPTFILTASRSGSTLLRFLLDSHPDLACPPETSIASACVALSRSWHLVGNADSGNGRPVNVPTDLPPHAAAAIRAAVDQVFGHYLAHRGKRRWCDKSLDTYQFADSIAQVYPEAKFICLFRHCMDVIGSGVETCPWGLSRFGFDAFAAQFPGNSVAAIGSYWLSCAQAIMAFEEKHPQACMRVRYEDLVSAPEETAAEIFSFLGAAPAPGITTECFRTPHEGGGPGDEKIWFTTEVTPASIGRGISVPAAALPPPLRQSINETLAKLGYRLVDDRWNAAVRPVDPRVQPSPAAEASGSSPAIGYHPQGHDELAAVVRDLATRIESRDDAERREVSERWPAVAGATIALIVQSAPGDCLGLRLRFLPGGVATEAASDAVGLGTGAPASGDGEPAATMIASPATWRSLLEGQANIITEMTTRRLRCVNNRDDHRLRSDEVHAVARLIGMASIPMASATSHGPVGGPDAVG